MGAFAVAAVVADEYRDKRWVPWVAYGTAGLIGVSRVRLGRHFPSDVLVGGVLGSSIGRMVSARQGARRERLLTGLTPVVDPAQKRYGLMYSHSW
jgi:membrane-associated phospholipid phosphatase